MNIVHQFKYNNSNDYELIKRIRKQVIKLILIRIPKIRVSTGYDTRVDADVRCNEALTRILVWKKDSHHIQYFPLFQSTIIVLLT
jgi:hypothetical protein